MERHTTAKPITDVYEICDAGKYKSLFDITWNRTFQKANAMLFPGKVFAASSVPAFTTDVDDISTRKIYLQDGVVNSWGTYYHEAIQHFNIPAPLHAATIRVAGMLLLHFLKHLFFFR